MVENTFTINFSKYFSQTSWYISILGFSNWGDGVVQKAFLEEWDDGGNINFDDCDEGCLSEIDHNCRGNPLTCFSTIWGDGKKTEDKVWEDGNLNDGDGWSSTCGVEEEWIWMNGNLTG